MSDIVRIVLRYYVLSVTNRRHLSYPVIHFVVVVDCVRVCTISCCCLKKKQNAPRPSEHPPVRRENVKTFRWDHRLHIQNLFMEFKQVPLW